MNLQQEMEFRRNEDQYIPFVDCCASCNNATAAIGNRRSSLLCGRRIIQGLQDTVYKHGYCHKYEQRFLDSYSNRKAIKPDLEDLNEAWHDERDEKRKQDGYRYVNCCISCQHYNISMKFDTIICENRIVQGKKDAVTEHGCCIKFQQFVSKLEG